MVVNRLYLTNNSLSTLSAGAFTSLQDQDHLEVLYLDYNELSSIHPSAFTGLQFLQVLCLNDNRLSSVVDGSLDHLSGLNHLYMNNNQLTGLSNYVFVLPNLKTLTLGQNNLTSMGEQAFQHCTYLQTLVTKILLTQSKPDPHLALGFVEK